MKDRRRLERFALNLPAEVQVAHPDGTEETFELVTTNVCAGGAFFDTLFPLPEGIAVEIGLFLTFRQSKKVDWIQGAHPDQRSRQAVGADGHGDRL